MKTAKELKQELEVSGETFNASSFADCVDRAMALVQHDKAVMLEGGLKWPFSSDDVLRAACERKIEERNPGESIWYASVKFVMEVVERAEVYNGVFCEKEYFISKRITGA